MQAWPGQVDSQLGACSIAALQLAARMPLLCEQVAAVVVHV